MTLANAPTKYLEAGGARIAYRQLGPADGTPLICLQHFTGTMDAWDPAVIDALARDRPVVVFNNKGVGTSGGETPDSVDQMSVDAASFISGLGFSRADLPGFSLGGMIAQLLAAEHPALVRKALLVGTAPQGGEEHLMEVVRQARSHKEAPDPRLPLFFTPSAESQAAGLAFLKRAGARTADRDPDNGDAVARTSGQSPDRLVRRQGYGQCGLQRHPSADPGAERKQRHDASPRQRLFHVQASPERATEGLSVLGCLVGLSPIRANFLRTAPAPFLLLQLLSCG